jgi:hypothetical protein
VINLQAATGSYAIVQYDLAPASAGRHVVGLFADVRVAGDYARGVGYTCSDVAPATGLLPVPPEPV